MMCTHMPFSKKNHSTHSTYLFKIFFSLLTLSTTFLQKACGPGKNNCKGLYSYLRNKQNLKTSIPSLEMRDGSRTRPAAESPEVLADSFSSVFVLEPESLPDGMLLVDTNEVLTEIAITIVIWITSNYSMNIWKTILLLHRKSLLTFISFF